MDLKKKKKNSSGRIWIFPSRIFQPGFSSQEFQDFPVGNVPVGIFQPGIPEFSRWEIQDFPAGIFQPGFSNWEFQDFFFVGIFQTEFSIWDFSSWEFQDIPSGIFQLGFSNQEFWGFPVGNSRIFQLRFSNWEFWDFAAGNFFHLTFSSWDFSSWESQDFPTGIFQLGFFPNQEFWDFPSGIFQLRFFHPGFSSWDFSSPGFFQPGFRISLLTFPQPEFPDFLENSQISQTIPHPQSSSHPPKTRIQSGNPKKTPKKKNS